MCCLAKECVHTSGNDNGLNLALFASGARVHSITRAFGHRKGLTGECRLQSTQKSEETQFNISPIHIESSNFNLHYLINFQWIPFKQTSVSWNDIPKLHTDDVPWHKDGRFLLGPPAISENLLLRQNRNQYTLQANNTALQPHSKRDPVSTLALGARRAMRAAAALPALFSSMKLIVELMMSRVMIPTKSCQSGGLFWKKNSVNTHQNL
jgi:hypothetical protein